MNKIGVFLWLIICSFFSFGQEIIISFTGYGDTTGIDSVFVQNLSNGTSILVPNGLSLNLTQGELGIDDFSKTNVIFNYPNPFKNSTYIEFFVCQEENIDISIFDIVGKEILHTKEKLNKGKHIFEFRAEQQGIYFVKVAGKNNYQSLKMICSSSELQGFNLVYQGQISNSYQSKKELTLSDFSFTLGDTLLLKGMTGDYSTIQVVVPTISTTYSFHFVACRDYEGNSYSIVEIGSQIWMAENLKSTYYPDGAAIPYITDNTEWGNLADNDSADAYCYYNNDTSSEYGALYSYAAAIADNWEHENNNGQGVCPDGWHLPTVAEWQELVSYLGDSSVAGGKLKETGINHWTYPNIGATNESGFSAFGSGNRYYNNGEFGNIRDGGHWWTATEYSGGAAWKCDMGYISTQVGINGGTMSDGISVRCIRDY